MDRVRRLNNGPVDIAVAINDFPSPAGTMNMGFNSFIEVLDLAGYIMDIDLIPVNYDSLHQAPLSLLDSGNFLETTPIISQLSTYLTPFPENNNAHLCMSGRSVRYVLGGPGRNRTTETRIENPHLDEI